MEHNIIYLINVSCQTQFELSQVIEENTYLPQLASSKYQVTWGKT